MELAFISQKPQHASITHSHLCSGERFREETMLHEDGPRLCLHIPYRTKAAHKMAVGVLRIHLPPINANDNPAECRE